MSTLTAPQQALLRSSWQRSRLLVAVFPEFRLVTSTTMRDATKEFAIQPQEWSPVLNIGPNRIGFVGEQLTFDAIDSYRYIFDGQGKRQRASYQGYGKGFLPQLNWTINGPSGQSWRGQSWTQAITWTPSLAGAYTIECYATGYENWVSRRHITVYANRTATDWEVAGIEGISGSWGEGWSAQIRLSAPLQNHLATSVGDYQGIGIYCEDSWFNGSSWDTQTQGSTRQEPRCLMIGYVREGSIQYDMNARVANLQLESVTGQMDRSMHHKIAIWDQKGPEPVLTETAAQGGDSNEARREARRKARQKKKKELRYDGENDEWGTVLKGFQECCVSDFALYLLQFKTNLLQYHDFYTTWNLEMAALESIAGEETSVLGNLQTVAGNDWFVAGAMADNAIYFAPDRQVMRDTDWEAKWPYRMEFTADDMLSWEPSVLHENPVKYVKLVATKTADFTSNAKRRKRQKREEERNQIEVSYPAEDPSTTEPGNWYVRSDLLHDDKTVIQTRAQSLYTYLNTRWAGSLQTALNHAVHPGDLIRLNPPNTSTIWGGTKLFLVTSVSYTVDLEKGLFGSTIEFEERA